MEWITSMAYTLELLKDKFLSYFPGYQPSVRYEAYALDPTGAYFVFMVGAMFVSAFLCHIAELKLKSIHTFNVFEINFMKSACIWHLTMLSLPSYNDNVAIFETAKLFPHLIIACMIGIVLNDISGIYIDRKVDIVLSMSDIFTLSVQVFKVICYIFVLTNPIIMNIYLYYVYAVEFSRLCRFSIKYIYTIYFGQYSKHALHIVYYLMLTIEYYVAFYIMFMRFRSILPKKEIFVLKSVNVGTFILSNINLWEDMIVDRME